MKKVYYTHSAHLDLFWMGNMEYCMKRGAEIIDAAVEDLSQNAKKYFVIETVRFLEYYLYHYPHRKEEVRRLFANGQLEIGACYSDRMENQHDGEALVRNVLYGKKILKELLGIDTKLAVHPDLPGLTEQTPQIYRKAGVEYYLFARGYENGARFLWRANDASTIIAYNYPIHYCYYDPEKIIRNMKTIEKEISSDTVLICLSAGDLGDYGTFVKNERVDLVDMIQTYNESGNDYEFVAANVYKALNAMDTSDIPVYQGESPCRWGTYGSATNVTSFQQDKSLSALLMDAEKFLALCEVNHLDVSGFHTDYPFDRVICGHTTRRYFDKIILPDTPLQWIDFAWRLQLVTQDHNYGGADGITSDSDRSIFKKCAIKIAKDIIQFCIMLISTNADVKGDFVAFNLFNWERNGRVNIPDGLIADKKKKKIAKDGRGVSYPVVYENGDAYINADIRPLGYESFTLGEAEDILEINGFAEENEDEIILESRDYRIVICKKCTGILEITDKCSCKNLVGERPIGIMNAYEDLSVDVQELIYDRKLLDSTQGKTKFAACGRNEEFIWATIETEICDSKVVLEVKLSATKKEYEILPTIYWTGNENVQIRMTFDLNGAYGDLYYGVPYGIQKFGNYIHGAYPASPTDEIPKELFDEYREIQGWFAVESGRDGISVCTNQSSFAYKKGNIIDAVLIRNVKSCGDYDVLISNHGKQAFYFVCTSYQGDSVLKSERYYRHSWDLRSTLYTFPISKSTQKGLLGNTLLESSSDGILSVLRCENHTCTARCFSVTEGEKSITLNQIGRKNRISSCNLMGNIERELATLKEGEIKTVKIDIQ